MAIFRDLDGNFFDIPDEDLERYRVEGELPEDAQLTGMEADSDGGGASQHSLSAASVESGGKYYWPDYLWQGPDAAAYAAADNNASGEPMRL